MYWRELLVSVVKIRLVAIRILLLVIFIYTSSSNNAIAIDKLSFLGKTEKEGYSRLIFSFPKMPEYSVEIIGSILVVSWNTELKMRIDQASLNTPEFIITGRADPDGRAARFALAQNVRINVIEAGDKLFVDLLPQNWVGLPPGLPNEVIAELTRRALEAEKAAAIEARKKAMAESKYKVNIRTGTHPTFSRIVFDWNNNIGTKLSRKNNIITVQFDQYAKIDLARLKVDPPRFIKTAKSILDPIHNKLI